MTTGGPVLALDIGGTKINAAVVHDGRLGPVVSCPTPADEGGQAVMATAIDLGHQAVRAYTGDNGLHDGGITAPVAVGVASAGIINTTQGSVSAATDAIRGWAGTGIAGPCADAFGVASAVLNDVHAHGLGEAVFGVGRDHDSLLLMAIGTGIGGAFVTRRPGTTHPADGACGAVEVATGGHGAAGHVGHLSAPEAGDLLCSCGRRGHLEALASGPGIAAELTRRGIPAANTREVAALANASRAGDSATAAEVLRTAGFATGRALGGLLNVLDPGVVAVTGGVAEAAGHAGRVWWQALGEGVEHDAMDAVSGTRVIPAHAGNHAALLGAAVHAVRVTQPWSGSTTSAAGPLSSPSVECPESP